MNGSLASTVRTLAPRASRRLVLTGTPMPRSPEDLWSLFTFLWPTESLLGNAHHHAIRCKGPIEQVCGKCNHCSCRSFIGPAKVDLGLPPIESVYPEISPEDVPATQRLLLRLIERRTLEEISYLRPVDQRHLRRWRRARIIRLLQATSNPLLLADALNAHDVVAVGDDDERALETVDPTVVPLGDTDSDFAAVFRKYRDSQQLPAK